MESSHRTNVLVTSCLKTPVDPHTKAPLAQYERERALPYASGHVPDNRDYEKEMEYDSETEGSDVEGQGESGNPLLLKNYRVAGEPIDLREFYFSNEEYYMKLEELKRAHLQTMAELEGMYRKKLEVKGTGPPDKSTAEETRRSHLEKNYTMPVANLRKAFSAVELNQIGGCGLSDTSEEADNDAAVEKGLLSSPKEHIRTMWQDFTVGELTPRNRQASRSSLRSQSATRRGRGRGGSRAQSGDSGGRDQYDSGWRHRVTVPQPFQMTLREMEKKRRKVKTRSEVELENALLKKQLEELTECQKKFRASPVPAHVYLPLYEDITTRNEERRRFFRQRDQHNLLNSQKPFSFLERERLKKEQREAQLQKLAPKEERKTFRAKPVPKSLYDSTVSDQIKEDQLYRAIKMQMRAQELLHSASMPRSMLAKRLSEKRKEAATERTVETEADFRPRINAEVPDFDASYRKFRKQLQSRRDVKTTTVCEPFQLRTAQISSHRDRILADIEAEQTSPRATRWPYIAPTRTASSSLCSSLSGSQELLPTKITDASRKRQEAVRKVLEQRKKAEEEEERWRERQKQREKRLQKVINKRAQANDPHVALSQTCKSKLKQFRKQDLQRKKEYQEEMREIQERVRGRPLLLEQVTQRNAKQAAEKRYADTLRGYGLSEDFVNSKAPKQQQCDLTSARSSISSEEKRSNKQEPVAGSPTGAESYADDYPDDYEEFDDQELYGEERDPEEDRHEYRKDTDEEEDDKADQSDEGEQENEPYGNMEDRYLHGDEQEGEEGEEESEARHSNKSWSRHGSDSEGSKGSDVEGGKERNGQD
ncbi:hypothetical protein AGOR_G00099140 [Albula goreensis]|uniref:Protein FAM161A n=1 Tax=Albula goreensis TaxID=1534307 RepID=A0A8T3DLX1_9TELE|nr:hypothetical protein AGOR_G00099140 [Albula goreensis]